MSVEPRRRLFNVDEYYAMARAGILDEDDRVELIEGEIVRMTPIGSRHAACVDRLTRILSGFAGPDEIVRVQNPVRLGDLSEPEPDLALLKGRDDFYARRHPGPEDVLLIVEVAETSLEFDLGRKLPLYATSGVPEVWIVDLDGDRIEAHHGPAQEGYRERRIRTRGETLQSAGLTELKVAVDEVLG